MSNKPKRSEDMQDLKTMYGGTTVTLKDGSTIIVEELPLLDYPEKLFSGAIEVFEKLVGSHFDKGGKIKFKVSDLPAFLTLATKEMVEIIEIFINKPNIFKEKKLGLNDGISLLNAILIENRAEEMEKNVKSLAHLVKNLNLNF